MEVEWWEVSWRVSGEESGSWGVTNCRALNNMVGMLEPMGWLHLLVCVFVSGLAPIYPLLVHLMGDNLIFWIYSKNNFEDSVGYTFFFCIFLFFFTK